MVKAVPECSPNLKSLATDLQSKAFDCLLEQVSEYWPDYKQGLELGLKVELCLQGSLGSSHLINGMQSFHSLRNHRLDCKEFEFLFFL